MGQLKVSKTYGIHTIELYAKNLKYTEVQKVIDRLVETGEIQKAKSDFYNIDRHFKSTYFVEDGIRMRIHQSHNKSNGIGFAINPSTVLSGKYQPVKLWEPTPEAVDELLERLSLVLKLLGLDSVYSTDLSLSQMDVTENIWGDEDLDPTVWVRQFRKGIVPQKFEAVVNEDTSLKPYLYIISSKRRTSRPGSVVVKAYDKIHELKVNKRCPKQLKNEKILRFEVSMKREAFLKKLNLDRKTSLSEMLQAGYDQGKEIIAGYKEEMYPFTGEVVPYKEAKSLIQKKVKKELLREKMLYLLKKTSDSTGVSAAVQKLKENYSGVDDRRIKKIFAEFDKLNISPVTKPKDK